LPKYDHQVASINQFRSKQCAFIVKGSQFKENPEVKVFLSEMNKNCARLNLRSSFFDSPHGLMNINSRSTAYDMAKLGTICMQDPRFAKVVGTRNYHVPRKKEINQNKRTYRWENTHKMIDQPGVTGIKTGITNSAGPCLATAINYEESELVVVLLNCKNMDCRWLETHKLAKWAA
jgi:serine-type D-Ala-D-Ala carboxypeptidase (penicillin-binding protein 5/6)